MLFIGGSAISLTRSVGLSDLLEYGRKSSIILNTGVSHKLKYTLAQHESDDIRHLMVYNIQFKSELK